MLEPTLRDYQIAQLDDNYYHGDSVVRVHKLVKQHSQGLLTNEDLLDQLALVVLARGK